MFSDRHKDFSSKVSALLATMELIFEVYCGCTVLGEQLGELQNGGKTTVAAGLSVCALIIISRSVLPCVTVCNDGPQIVDIRRLCAVLRRHLPTLIIVFAIVQLLCFEQSLNLVRNRIVGIVTEVRGDLIGGRQD